jgi:hypothetical protein
MDFHTSDENNYESSTICITGCNEDWAKISEMLKKETSIFEIVTPQNELDKLREDSKQRPTYGKYLDLLRIKSDDTISHDMFEINVTGDVLGFNGSRKSLDYLQDLADEFARNDGKEGDHVHISYIDFDGYEYNWFSNKNIELILGVLN